MHELVILLAVIIGTAVWVGFSGRNTQVAHRRHDEECHSTYGGSDCLHIIQAGVGFMLGPVWWLIMTLYELGDGTTLRHYREWRARKRDVTRS